MSNAWDVEFDDLPAPMARAVVQTNIAELNRTLAALPAIPADDAFTFTGQQTAYAGGCHSTTVDASVVSEFKVKMPMRAFISIEPEGVLYQNFHGGHLGMHMTQLAFLPPSNIAEWSIVELWPSDGSFPLDGAELFARYREKLYGMEGIPIVRHPLETDTTDPLCIVHTFQCENIESKRTRRG